MSAERSPRGALARRHSPGRGDDRAVVARRCSTSGGTWPRVSAFSRRARFRRPIRSPYTAEGRPWVNHMWATQVLFTLLWERWGRFALIGLKTATIVATFWVVLGTMRARGVHPLLASAVTLLAAWTGAEILARAAADVHVPVRGHPHLAPAPGLGAPPRHARAGAGAGGALGEPPRRVHDGVPGDRPRRTGHGAAAPRRSGRRRAGWRVVGLTALLGLAAAAASLLNPFGAAGDSVPARGGSERPVHDVDDPSGSRRTSTTRASGRSS